MSNEITFTVKIDDKGSLALVTKEAKKTAAGVKKVDDATQKATKSQNHYNRGAKGVGQAGLSASKGFSKMRDSMSGSNGLVSAYAILAANIFAATAAFNALRRAAQIEQLAQGLREVGAAAGQNLPDIANSLKEITGNAVSSEQAMRATAVAISAGFRSDQLVQLTKVAKGASIALGRDMGDALDRLVRGTAKLEPEILDELGIMVRLDDAVRVYSDRLGIAVGSLTQFDRRQAFLNATIKEGLEKFEDLSKSIDANPYDKLAASLADLQKAFIKGLSGLTGLNKGISFASRNLSSLTAVASTLALGITRGVAPGLFRMADSAAATANGALAAQTAVAGLATEGSKLPPKFAKLAGALQNGTATSKDFATANSSLTGQLGGLTRGLNGLTKGTEEYASKSAEISGVRGQMAELAKLEDLQGKARVTNARASALGSAANFNLRDSFGSLKTAFKEDKITTDASIKGKKGLKITMKSLGPAFRIAGTGAKAFGAALFTALPYIGIIISVVSVLYNVIKEKFFPEDLVKKRIEDAKESFKQFNEVQARFMTSSSEGAKKLAESYIALAGVLDQIDGKIRQVASADIAQYLEELTAQNIELQTQRRLLDEANEAKKSYKPSASDAMGGVETPAMAAFRLEGQIEDQVIKVGKKKDQIAKAGLVASKKILGAAIFELSIQKEVAKQTGVSAFNTGLMADSMIQLEALQARLKKGDITYSEFLVQLELIRRYPNEVKASFQQLDILIATFNGTMNKRAQKAKKLYQEEEEGAQGIIDRFKELGLAAKERDSLGKPTEKATEAVTLIEKLEEKILKLKVGDAFKNNGVAGVTAFVKAITNARTTLATMEKTLAKNKSQFALLKDAAKGVIGGQGFIDAETNLLITEEVALIDEKLKTEALILGITVDEYLTREKGLVLDKQKSSLLGKEIDDKIILKKNEIDLLKLEKLRNSLAKKRMDIDKRVFAIRAKAASAGGKLTPKREFDIAMNTAKVKLEAAKLDVNFINIKLNLERELLVLQMGGQDALTDKHKVILELLDAQSKVVRQIANTSVRSAQTGVTETIQGGAGEYGTGMSRIAAGSGMSDMTSQIASMQGYSKAVGVAAAAQSELTMRQAEAKALKKEIDAESGKSDGGDKDRIAVMQAEKAILNDQIATSQAVLLQAQQNVKNSALEMVTSTITGMSEALVALGPEGVLAASFGNLSNIMLTSVVGALEVMSIEGVKTSQILAAGFAAAAGVIGGIASILQAQSNVAVEAIDRQIEAEKKLDGQSAKSVAKIQSMEAKKEAIKKKTFETDKKLKIAGAIMSTAAGIAQSLSLPFPMNFIMAGIVGAMGAAQIAVISGMSYQGGGSASTPSMPSKIGIGERGKGVDLASSQSARGELSYLRGEDGTGGSGNFKPAFTGAKYRASGGETAGFMVGEQGPEMFIPDRSGRIAPADEVQAGGAPAQVTFNINTIDASGVEDMLTVQRGNIIGMIRSAANSYGQSFVEDVDTSTLQNSAAAMGVGRY